MYVRSVLHSINNQPNENDYIESVTLSNTMSDGSKQKDYVENADGSFLLDHKGVSVAYLILFGSCLVFGGIGISSNFFVSLACHFVRLLPSHLPCLFSFQSASTNFSPPNHSERTYPLVKVRGA